MCHAEQLNAAKIKDNCCGKHFVKTEVKEETLRHANANFKDCDKRHVFTVKSPNNKGRNAANNTLKRNFPTLMFHQKNRC